MSMHAQDSRPIKIGSQSAYGSRRSNRPANLGNSNGRANVSTPPRTRPLRRSDKIVVRIENVYVAEIKLDTLVRYSKNVSKAFPRLYKADANQQHDIPGHTITLENGRTVLELKKSGVLCSPSPGAISDILYWMEGDKWPSVRGFLDNDYDLIGFEWSVQQYAANLLLEVRPLAVHLVGELINHVTDQAPHLADLELAHAYLPVENVVITRLLTSFFEHLEIGHYNSIPEERQAIESYVDTRDASGNHAYPRLFQRYTGIKTQRELNAARAAPARVSRAQNGRRRRGRGRNVSSEHPGSVATSGQAGRGGTSSTNGGVQRTEQKARGAKRAVEKGGQGVAAAETGAKKGQVANGEGRKAKKPGWQIADYENGIVAGV